MLIRKFFLLQTLRSVYTNQSFDDMMRETNETDNPVIQFVRRFCDVDAIIPSDKSFISDLECLMQFDSIEDLLHHQDDISPSLFASAQSAYVSYFAFWDAAESGREFLFAKLPGIGLQDQQGPLYKTGVLNQFLKENARKLSYMQSQRYNVIFSGTLANVDNYWLCPLSPTRAIVGISPYFKAFFHQQRGDYRMPYIPALLPKRQFQYHFYEPTRMELFEPCTNRNNRNYTFHVKELTKREVLFHNALVLNEEQEEFAFHDYEKVKDSFGAYELLFTLRKKKHDYSRWV